jgi:hypothetical protein
MVEGFEALVMFALSGFLRQTQDRLFDSAALRMTSVVAVAESVRGSFFRGR